MRMIQRALPIIGLLVATLIGCEAAPETTQPNRRYRVKRPAQPTPPSESSFGNLSQATAVAEGQSLMPLEERRRAYRIIEGDRGGSTTEVRLERVDAPDAPWRRHTPGKRIEHIALDDKGNVVIAAVEDLTHDTRSTYSPPMVLIPAHLEPGEPQTFTSRVRVVDRQNRDLQRASGTTSRTITLAANQTLFTPAGRFRCRRLDIDQEADIGPAHVSITSREWYSSGAGLIAEDYHERLSALLILNSETTRKMVMEKR